MVFTLPMVGLFIVLSIVGMCLAAVADAAEPVFTMIGVILLIVLVVRGVACISG